MSERIPSAVESRIIQWSRNTSTNVERLLASAIVVGVIIFTISSLLVLVEMDWKEADTFYEMIYRSLIIVIGVELTRTLLTHDLNAILELLCFVVARKMLTPEITSVDIILSVLAFTVLLFGKRYLLDLDHKMAAKTG